MHDLTSGAPREGYFGEDRHGRSIEGDALLRDRWIATFEPAQRPPSVAEIMISIHAGAQVVQVGPEHYQVTAPLEVIPRLVKARDCTPQPTCKVEFFEQAPLRGVFPGR